MMTDVRELRDAIDLRGLAGDLGIQADSRSRRMWCPFANHGRPNFSVTQQRFRCFACGVGGDAIELVKLINRCDFLEAISFLARYSGAPAPRGSSWKGCRTSRHASDKSRKASPRENPTTQAQALPSVAILSAFARAARIPADAPDDHPGLRFLASRGIARQTALAAGVGYLESYAGATDELRRKVSADRLVACGLFNKRGNLVLWKHRLLFPFAFEGGCHGFQARNIHWRSREEDGPKELRIGEAPLPFNADVLRNALDEVFICEGIIDALSATDIGLAAVGIPGATAFCSHWASLFLHIPRIVLAFDQDDAGRKATERVLNFFAAQGRRDLKILRLPPGIKDVNEWLTSGRSR
jgi:DNA primase